MTKKLGSYKGNDIELCRTTNARVCEAMAEALVEAQIPYVRNCKRIPWLKRVQYGGANEVWIVSISPRRYSQARRLIDSMDRVLKERLVLTNY